MAPAVGERTPQLVLGSRLPGTPYRIVRLIGMGGMGEVYEAEHEELGVRRALKVLMPHASGPERVARMRAEARALARLRHRNLVEVLDLGTASDGRCFLAMELLAGVSLRELLTCEGALPVGVALHVTLAMLSGLEAAHGIDLVHRDVKPDNVVVCEDGGVRLLDFGVAKFLASDQAFTQSGVALGTPRYMAPEQVQGEPVDLRTDLYAVGVVLYEMLAGRPPFVDDQLIALAYAHVMRPPPPLWTLRPSLPGPLVEVVARALEKRPDDRFEAAPAFAAALRAAVGDGVPSSVDRTLQEAQSDLARDVRSFRAARDGAPGVAIPATTDAEAALGPAGHDANLDHSGPRDGGPGSELDPTMPSPAAVMVSPLAETATHAQATEPTSRGRRSWLLASATLAVAAVVFARAPWPSAKPESAPATAPNLATLAPSAQAATTSSALPAAVSSALPAAVSSALPAAGSTVAGSSSAAPSSSAGSGGLAPAATGRPPPGRPPPPPPKRKAFRDDEPLILE